MSRQLANGYFDKTTVDEQRKLLNAQRTEDYKNTCNALMGGVPDQLPDNAPSFLIDYFDYYKTSRGYHPRSVNSNDAWTKVTPLPFMNMPLLTYADEIRNPVLMIHGSKTHSLYFSEDAFKKLKGDSKELLIIPDAVHTDLYNNLKFIPFDKIEAFFAKNLSF